MRFARLRAGVDGSTRPRLRLLLLCILVAAGALITAPAGAVQPVLYDQMTLTSAPAAIRSHATGDPDTEGFAADDFIVPETWAVGGVRIETTLVPDGTIAVLIRGDAAGEPAPGEAFCAASGLTPEVTHVGDFQKILELDLPAPCTLPAGTWWLSVIGESVGSQQVLLEWFSSGGGQPPLGTSPLLYDNTGPGGCGAWTPATQCFDVNGKVSAPENAVNLHFAILEPEAPNQPPTANAGGPYVVLEGDSTTLDGSGSTDAEGDPLAYSWDLDGDLAFETAGSNPTFDASNLDGPAVKPVAVQVCDPQPACGSAGASVSVQNVPPTATFGNQTGTILQGASATLAFSDAADPATADTAAGFTYTFDCTDDGTLESTGAASSFACTYPTAGLFTAEGAIADKDGGLTTYTSLIEVLLPAEAIEDAIDQVEALVQDGTLNQGQGNSLMAKLENAKQKLDDGQEQTAINLLEAFVNQVESYISNGLLTQAEGQALIELAEAIIESIEAT